MHEYFPLLMVGGIIGLISAVFIAAYALMKDKKEAIGFDRNMKDGEIIKRLLSYAFPYRVQFLFAFLCVLFSIMYDVISPLLVGKVEEMLTRKFELSRLYTYVLFYVSLLIVSSLFSYIQAVILHRMGQRVLSDIRRDIFSHIESLSHSQLSMMPVGKLVTRVTNDTNAISMMFTDIIVNLVKNSFVIVGVLCAMLTVNLQFTLMVLCFVPFIVLFTVIFRKFTRKAYRKVKDRTTDINTFLSENLSGIKIIQIFNREERKKREFEEKNQQLGKAKREQIFTFGIFRPLVYMLYISSVLCLLYLGGRGYIKNTEFLGQTVTSATVVTFYMYISKFFNPIQNFAEQFNMMQSAMASAEKIFTVLDIQPEITDSPDAVDVEKVNGDIEFDHVWFAYKEGEWVLKDVSFTVKAGQTAAFVGATGSGKTTILSLLCRNYEIQKGRILLDGVDIRNIKISSLRSHFGQMLQDVFLFSGTVRSNIVLREDKFTDEQIMEACRYVNADKIIDKLPKGLDEQVRERGNNFSSGQRQLISFARTVIHRPEVMILDEATANIDTETEALIQDSLEKIMNIGTLLIVAHRLSTVQHSDVIFYLDKGRITESGTHTDLLELKGKYYGLYKLQHDRASIVNS